MKIFTIEYPKFILGKANKRYHDHIMAFAEEIYKCHLSSRVPFFLHFRDCILILARYKEGSSSDNLPESLQILAYPKDYPLLISQFKFDPRDHESVSMEVSLDLPWTEKYMNLVRKYLDKWFDDDYIRNTPSSLIPI